MSTGDLQFKVESEPPVTIRILNNLGYNWQRDRTLDPQLRIQCSALTTRQGRPHEIYFRYFIWPNIPQNGQ